MSNDIIDSRGRFWVADLAIPDGHYAPEESVPGRMRVLANGRTIVELDATLPMTTPRNAFDHIVSRAALDASACGFLIDGNRHVWLSHITGDGGSLGGGGGPMWERLVADRCLVSTEAFPPGIEPRFRWLDLPLDGYEEWLGRGKIAVARGRRRLTATFTKSATRRWRAGRTTLELHRWLKGGVGKDETSLTWRERALLRVGAPGRWMSVEEAVDRASRMEDLLILLSDCNRGLNYFSLRRRLKDNPVQLYYTRGERPSEQAASWHRAWVRFGACADDFGKIADTWFEGHERYGPGFHLYLGNRRGHPMYPEHTFASLVWGLEALHRSLYPTKPNPRLEQKVERILAQIQLDKDRDWAARNLHGSTEPQLQERLFKLLSMLPTPLDRKQLGAFTQRCAAHRNDVSHFGGERAPGEYASFLKEIVHLGRALDILYHALLLHLVGVSDEAIDWYLTEGFSNHQVRGVLGECGLDLPEPKPARSTPPGA